MKFTDISYVIMDKDSSIFYMYTNTDYEVLFTSDVANASTFTLEHAYVQLSKLARDMFFLYDNDWNHKKLNDLNLAVFKLETIYNIEDI